VFNLKVSAFWTKKGGTDTQHCSGKENENKRKERRKEVLESQIAQVLSTQIITKKKGEKNYFQRRRGGSRVQK